MANNFYRDVHDLPNFPCAPQGDKIIPLYGLKVMPDGSHDLAVIGETNSYEYIQSHNVGLEVQDLVDNFMRTGDASRFNVYTGQYGDFSNVPSSFCEFQQLMIDTRQVFDRLPIAERSKFDMDFNKFLKAIDNGEFILEKPKTEVNDVTA